MNTCNHGPSRFYRTSFRFGYQSFLYAETVTVLHHWHGRLCDRIETTVSCPVNSSRCN